MSLPALIALKVKPSGHLIREWIDRLSSMHSDTFSPMLRAAPGSFAVNDEIGIILPRFAHFFPHRFAAALAAIWERLRGDSAAALAAPPFSPPRRPSATAAGFFFFGGSVFGCSPIDSRNTLCASWFGSRGRVFERSGIREPIIPTVVLESTKRFFKLTHYPDFRATHSR
jgi:hypothetical protein